MNHVQTKGGRQSAHCVEDLVSKQSEVWLMIGANRLALVVEQGRSSVAYTSMSVLFSRCYLVIHAIHVGYSVIFNDIICSFSIIHQYFVLPVV